MTLISDWGGFVLDRPVLVAPGETIWTEKDPLTGLRALMVRRTCGRVDAYPGDLCR